MSDTPTSNETSGIDANALRVVCQTSIDQISAELWDSVNGPKGLFWTHRFLRAVEHSGVEQSKYHYLMFYDAEELVGTAVLSCFVVSLDMFMPSLMQKTIRLLRHLRRSFLRLRVLFCGLPLSVGKHTIAIVDPAYNEAVMERLCREMQSIAEHHGIRYLCLKEFAEAEADLGIPFERRGFFKALSLPRLSLDIRWPDFDAYLQSMRHTYRRHVRQSLARLDNRGQTIALRPYDKESSYPPSLVTAPIDGYLASLQHKLYLEVINRVPIKLEILNESFFRNLSQYCRDDLVLLAVVEETTPHALAIVSVYDRTLTFVFVGIDYAHRDQHHAYINLLTGMVAYAIEHDCHTIDLGQTSYWLKQRLGGTPTQVYFFFKSRQPVVHALLRLLNPLLFPRTRLPHLRVFRC